MAHQKVYYRLRTEQEPVSQEEIDDMDLMFRGKHLLTVEQWEKFASCPACGNQKCADCVSGPSGLTEVEQFEKFHFPIEDGDSEDEYLPRKLWDITIQCCSCGSRHHIIDWVNEAVQPEIYYVPEAEEAMLRAAKEEREGSLPATKIH